MPRPDGGRPVLQVRDLRTRFRTQGGGAVHAVNGVGFDLHAGELLGVVGESGSGKSVTMLSLLRLLPSPPAEIASGQALLDGEDLLALEPRAPASRARRQGGLHLPGPDGLAQPGAQRRLPARRAAADASGPGRTRGAAPGGGAAGAGRHSDGGTPPRRLSAPVLGRDAPAGDDRDGARLRSRGAHRRRAHDCARRHHSGPYPGPAAAAEKRARHGRSSGSPTTSAWWPASRTG